ncbi:MAG: hypothetical protein ACRYGI_11550 [Janthinobacterium lividum]
MTALAILAARVESHSPIGRHDVVQANASELNEAIAIAIGLPLTVKRGHPVLGNERTVPNRILDYVGSLDAAKTLVPDGMGISIAQHGKRGDDCSAYVGKSDSDARGNFMTDTFTGEAKTMAGALTAACLRARAGRDPVKPRAKARPA